MPRVARNGTPTVEEGHATTVGPAPSQLVSRWRDSFYEEVRERPVRSVLLAVGSGYLAGGGLGTILTARLLSLGARVALRLAVLPFFAGEIERAVFGNEPAARPDSKTSSPKRLIHEKEIES